MSEEEIAAVNELAYAANSLRANWFYMTREEKDTAWWRVYTANSKLFDLLYSESSKPVPTSVPRTSELIKRGKENDASNSI